MMLTINIKLNYPMVICSFMLISLRAIEVINKMKSKAPTLEIKAFYFFHRFVISKVQQVRQGIKVLSQ